jgi:hypothetical protein
MKRLFVSTHLQRLKWIQERNVEALKIADIPGDYGESMVYSSRGNHCILIYGI